MRPVRPLAGALQPTLQPTIWEPIMNVSYIETNEKQTFIALLAFILVCCCMCLQQLGLTRRRKYLALTSTNQVRRRAFNSIKELGLDEEGIAIPSAPAHTVTP